MLGYAGEKGTLRHTRARQELASWSTWKDEELSEERNGGKDLQFGRNDSTRPGDTIPPSDSSVNRSPHEPVPALEFSSAANPQRNRFKKRHIPAHPCKTGDPRDTIGLLQRNWGWRQVQMRQGPQVDHDHRRGPSQIIDYSLFCLIVFFFQGLKGTWRATCFSAGNNQMRQKDRGMGQGGCLYAGGGRLDVGSTVRDRIRAGMEGERHPAGGKGF